MSNDPKIPTAPATVIEFRNLEVRMHFQASGQVLVQQGATLTDVLIAIAHAGGAAGQLMGASQLPAAAQAAPEPAVPSAPAPKPAEAPAAAPVVEPVVAPAPKVEAAPVPTAVPAPVAPPVEPAPAPKPAESAMKEPEPRTPALETLAPNGAQRVERPADGGPIHFPLLGAVETDKPVAAPAPVEPTPAPKPVVAEAKAPEAAKSALAAKAILPSDLRTVGDHIMCRECEACGRPFQTMGAVNPGRKDTRVHCPGCTEGNQPIETELRGFCLGKKVDQAEETVTTAEGRKITVFFFKPKPAMQSRGPALRTEAAAQETTKAQEVAPKKVAPKPSPDQVVRTADKMVHTLRHCAHVEGGSLCGMWFEPIPKGLTRAECPKHLSTALERFALESECAQVGAKYAPTQWLKGEGGEINAFLLTADPAMTADRAAELADRCHRWQSARNRWMELDPGAGVDTIPERKAHALRCVVFEAYYRNGYVLPKVADVLGYEGPEFYLADPVTDGDRKKDHCDLVVDGKYDGVEVKRNFGFFFSPTHQAARRAAEAVAKVAAAEARAAAAKQTAPADSVAPTAPPSRKVKKGLRALAAERQALAEAEARKAAEALAAPAVEAAPAPTPVPAPAPVAAAPAAAPAKSAKAPKAPAVAYAGEEWDAHLAAVAKDLGGPVTDPDVVTLAKGSFKPSKAPVVTPAAVQPSEALVPVAAEVAKPVEEGASNGALAPDGRLADFNDAEENSISTSAVVQSAAAEPVVTPEVAVPAPAQPARAATDGASEAPVAAVPAQTPAATSAEEPATDVAAEPEASKAEKLAAPESPVAPASVAVATKPVPAPAEAEPSVAASAPTPEGAAQAGDQIKDELKKERPEASSPQFARTVTEERPEASTAAATDTGLSN